MKKIYKKVNIQLLKLDEKDVITASTPDTSAENELTPKPFGSGSTF